MRTADLKVQLIGHTTFIAPVVEHKGEAIVWTGHHESNEPNGFPFSTVDGDAQSLLEFSGRSCYESYDHPNPRTASNEGYLAHILEVGHESILEHASVTFYITGISRALTHELIRHRHFSFSELSQRYVDVTHAKIVIPPAFEDYEDGQLSYAQDFGQNSYVNIHSILNDEGVKGKKAREAARAVMPNMTETKMVLTGNYRAVKHFLKMRDSIHADAEIRRLAQEIGAQMAGIAPNIFGGKARSIWQDNEDAA